MRPKFIASFLVVQMFLGMQAKALSHTECSGHQAIQEIILGLALLAKPVIDGFSVGYTEDVKNENTFLKVGFWLSMSNTIISTTTSMLALANLGFRFREPQYQTMAVIASVGAAISVSAMGVTGEGDKRVSASSASQKSKDDSSTAKALTIAAFGVHMATLAATMWGYWRIT